MNARNRYSLAVEKFTSLVGDVDGVVALFGSAASDKSNPQDFNLMVFKKRPIIVWQSPVHKESISQQWFNVLASKSPPL
ncbi:MAG TPA: hypothetical protein VMW53_01705 [archaeon]|nr:hypothetical protein [archaeon]